MANDGDQSWEQMVEDDWFWMSSHQWADSFSPFSDSGLNVQPRNEIGIANVAHASDSSVQESGTNFTNSSFGSGQEGKTHRNGLYDADLACQSLQHTPGSIETSTLSGSRSPASLQSETPTDHSTFHAPSNRQKLLIKPVDRPPARPKRTIKVLQFCNAEGCDKTFAYFYDLKRHRDDVHAQGSRIYKCGEPACGYMRPRKDKVNSHCDKRGHRSPSEIFVGQGRNPGELAAMLEQRRRKGKRRSVCKGCEKRERAS